MFVAQTLLLIVTFLSLVTRIMSSMQTTKEVNPHSCIAPCVNMWSVFFFLCHLLNVGACICLIAREGQVEWTTPNGGERRMNSNSIVSHATLFFIVSRVHVYTTKLRNITCALVATSVIPRSLECIDCQF